MRGRNRQRGFSRASSPQPLLGLMGWGSTNYMATANGTAVPGSTTEPFTVSAAVQILTQALGSASRSFGGTYDGTNGYAFRTQGSYANLAFVAVDGGGMLRSSPVYTIQASDVGKVLPLCGQYDGAALRLWVGGVEVASGTAITGYTPSGNGLRMGGVASLGVAASAYIYGMAGGVGAASPSDIAAHAVSFKATRSLGELPGVSAPGTWPVRNDASIANASGGPNMAKTGVLTLTTEPNPVWGY